MNTSTHIPSIHPIFKTWILVCANCTILCQLYHFAPFWKQFVNICGCKIKKPAESLRSNRLLPIKIKRTARLIAMTVHSFKRISYLSRHAYRMHGYYSIYSKTQPNFILRSLPYAPAYGILFQVRNREVCIRCASVIPVWQQLLPNPWHTEHNTGSSPPLSSGRVFD